MQAQILKRLSANLTCDLAIWCAQLPLEDTTKSGYVSGRTEMWFRFGSNLQSIPASRARVFRCPEPPTFISTLGDDLLPGWHSLLVCGGETSIQAHRDHGHFESEAVMINIGEAVYMEGKSDNFEALPLSEGDVVRLDIKKLHASKQLSPVRFHLTFRKIKSEFLPAVKS